MTRNPSEIVDEGGFPAAGMFLRGWLPFAVSALEQMLGVRLDDPDFRLVLSTTQMHEKRFPVSTTAASALEGPLDGDEGPPDHDSAPTESQFYAHGVATRARAALKLGPAVPDGAPVICLDVETLARLADEYEVTVEAMLAQVLVHELAHVLRGHIEDGEPTHGYVCEGDAQRDAWVLLTDALASNFSRLAAEARTGMVRLAEHQPGAYRRFGHSSPSTGRWQPTNVTPKVWVLTPTRETRVLAQSDIIETPFFPSHFGTPQVGDRVVLVSQDLAVGEWVVIGIGDESETQNEHDERVVAAIARENRGRKTPRWLHLRKPDAMLAAGPPPEGLHNWALRGVLIGDDRHLEVWAQAEKEPLDSALTTIGDALRAAFAESVAETLRRAAEAGVELPEFDVDGWDPFKD